MKVLGAASSFDFVAARALSSEKSVASFSSLILIAGSLTNTRSLWCCLLEFWHLCGC